MTYNGDPTEIAKMAADMLKDGYLTMYEQQLKLAAKFPQTQQPCKSCGACPTCGRGNCSNLYPNPNWWENARIT